MAGKPCIRASPRHKRFRAYNFRSSMLRLASYLLLLFFSLAYSVVVFFFCSNFPQFSARFLCVVHNSNNVNVADCDLTVNKRINFASDYEVAGWSSKRRRGICFAEHSVFTLFHSIGWHNNDGNWFAAVEPFHLLFDHFCLSLEFSNKKTLRSYRWSTIPITHRSSVL